MREDKEINYSEPEGHPRVVYPNDIMSDDNPFTELKSDAVRMEMKSRTSNPRS